MDNNLEASIYDMIEELNLAKKETIEMLANSRSLCRQHVDTIRVSDDEVTIKLHLNESIAGSSSDANSDSDDKHEPNAHHSHDSHINDNTRDKSITGLNDNKVDRSGIKFNEYNVNNCGDESLIDCDNESDVRRSNSFNIRSLRRTISETSHEDHTRGILKYPRDWNRRTVSESCYDFRDFDNYLSSEMFDFNLIEESYSEDDVYNEMKPKKNVRFADSVSQTVYRVNSSILGRRKKNQKRARNRKNSKSLNSVSDDISPEMMSDTKVDLNSFQDSQRSRQDSGYDSEDIVRDEVKLDICSNTEAHNCKV